MFTNLRECLDSNYSVILPDTIEEIPNCHCNQCTSLIIQDDIHKKYEFTYIWKDFNFIYFVNQSDKFQNYHYK